MIMIDIEMPKRCGECPCFHAEYPMHCKLIKPPDKNKRLEAPYGLPRPEWCPLKEQEAVKPTVSGAEEHDGHGNWWYQCGKCKTPIDHGDKFCRQCGQAVKWE